MFTETNPTLYVPFASCTLEAWQGCYFLSRNMRVDSIEDAQEHAPLDSDQLAEQSALIVGVLKRDLGIKRRHKARIVYAVGDAEVTGKGGKGGSFILGYSLVAGFTVGLGDHEGILRCADSTLLVDATDGSFQAYTQINDFQEVDFEPEFNARTAEGTHRKIVKALGDLD